MKNKNICFGFFENGFNPKISEFNTNFLSEISKDYAKFIQLIVDGKDYIRSGDLPHKTILKFSLDEFQLEYGLKKDMVGVPLAEGEKYKLVGAGRIKLAEDKLDFYGFSTDYGTEVSGTNLENLKIVLGKENISKGIPLHGISSYLVNFQGEL